LKLPKLLELTFDASSMKYDEVGKVKFIIMMTIYPFIRHTI
jgi:hypothetical protein